MQPSQCPIRKLTIARSASKSAINCAIEIARNVAALLPKMMSVTLGVSVLGAVQCPAQQPTNGALSVAVDGSMVRMDRINSARLVVNLYCRPGVARKPGMCSTWPKLAELLRPLTR
jgi:hypothetical protein